MKEEILAHLNEPRQLEKLYRTNKMQFKQAFSTLYPQLSENVIANFWNERLNYEVDERNKSTARELLVMTIISLIAGVIAKLPFILKIDQEFFYQRNIGFIIFPVLSAYFAWKHKLSIGKIIIIGGIILAGLFFINTLPVYDKSDTIILSCIHLLMVLWAVLGFSFCGEIHNYKRRLDYLKYNGDLVVVTTLIIIAGALLTGITIGLFSLIGFDIRQFYFENVVVFGLPTAPILGTYLIQANPHLVGKISPVIAKLFSPLVLIMLVVYLVAIGYSGKSPYNDREFLMMFNALLVGVMAIIFFSVAETKALKARLEVWVLFFLSLITIIVNSIALSAILFRISEWGITPNRTAVMGGNILILLNLLLVMVQLTKVLLKKTEISKVGKVIADYLPVYILWAVIVTFLFPFLFGFK